MAATSAASTSTTTIAPTGPSTSASLAKWQTRELPKGAHKDKVHALGWSCDGVRLATGSQDMTVRIWKPFVADYKNSASLKGHTSHIVSLVWDPGHPERLATVSEDKTLRIWDIRQGKEIHTIPIPEHPLNMAWSPDGQWIVVANKFNVFTIISAAQGSVHNSHKELDEANEMIFSQTADHLAVASGVGLKLFSAPSMDLLSTIDAHPASCASLDLDPRGRYLAMGSNDSLASLWDTKEWYCVRTFTKSDSPVRAVRFSHDGDLLAMATEDPKIDIASVESGATIHSIPITTGVQRIVQAISFAPNRLALAYAVDEQDSAGRWEGCVRVFYK